MKFSKWSKERIKLGAKSLTSRSKPEYDDPDVKYVTPPLPWWFIRKYLYRDEGAFNPEELQRRINQVQRRHVKDDTMLHVHVLKDVMK